MNGILESRNCLGHALNAEVLIGIYPEVKNEALKGGGYENCSYLLQGQW